MNHQRAQTNEEVNFGHDANILQGSVNYKRKHRNQYASGYRFNSRQNGETANARRGCMAKPFWDSTFVHQDYSFG